MALIRQSGNGAFKGNDFWRKHMVLDQSGPVEAPKSKSSFLLDQLCWNEGTGSESAFWRENVSVVLNIVVSQLPSPPSPRPLARL
jgi:hypothetical protein